MNDAKPTPGPWRVTGASAPRIETERGEVVARLEAHGFADAALIASAPDLYAALERLLAECRDIGPTKGAAADSLAEAEMAARAALAKVKP